MHLFFFPIISQFKSISVCKILIFALKKTRLISNQKIMKIIAFFQKTFFLVLCTSNLFGHNKSQENFNDNSSRKKGILCLIAGASVAIISILLIKKFFPESIKTTKPLQPEDKHDPVQQTTPEKEKTSSESTIHKNASKTETLINTKNLIESLVEPTPPSNTTQPTIKKSTDNPTKKDPLYFFKDEPIKIDQLPQNTANWMKENLTCAICTDEMYSINTKLAQIELNQDITITRCGHSFCSECLHHPITYNTEIPSETNPAIVTNTVETVIHGNHCPICREPNSF